MRAQLAAALAILLLTSCTAHTSSGPARSTSPTATASPTVPPAASSTPAQTADPDNLSREDKLTLEALLGPALRVNCDLTLANRQQCGKVYAAADRLVGVALAAMESMPKTKPYKEMASDGALYRKTYRTTVDMGCFGRAAPKHFDLCVTLSGFASLTYLTFTTPLVIGP